MRLSFCQCRENRTFVVVVNGITFTRVMQNVFLSLLLQDTVTITLED
jgi:hypothetical protein